jgi:1-acyl-sn-glycerol-3-phosphate acyltransferase
LRAIERFNIGVARVVNERRFLKRLSHAFLRLVGMRWVYFCTRNLLHVAGAETLAALRPERGVILVANHRSFFDFYVISSVLLRRCSWIRRMYFPVRSSYFYDRLDGLFVNGIMSGLAMYPPIFREPRRRTWNRQSIGFLARQLQERGTLVGFHPEGRRGTGDDPYTLMAAHPGVGELVYKSRAPVLPVFILGLSNDLKRQVAGNFNRKGPAITIVVGDPIDVERYADLPAHSRTYLRIAEDLRSELARLGERERELRRQVEREDVTSGVAEAAPRH